MQKFVLLNLQMVDLALVLILQPDDLEACEGHQADCHKRKRQSCLVPAFHICQGVKLGLLHR